LVLQVTAASALPGGQQTLTMNIRRGVGQLTTYVFQGGGCGDLLDLDADDSFLTENSSEVRGSVFPIIGTLDAHTAVYINYNSSQGWALIPNANSSFRTQEINGASFSGISSRSLTLRESPVSLQQL
jgi:hypothetical protein